MCVCVYIYIYVWGSDLKFTNHIRQATQAQLKFQKTLKFITLARIFLTIKRLFGNCSW